MVETENTGSSKTSKDDVEPFISRYKDWIGIAVLLLIVTFIGFGLYKFRENEETAFRYLLIGFLTLIPAIMYFVFIALRKTSLFHEYISNLYDLGLLNYYHTGGSEKDNVGRNIDYFNRSRIQGYLKRFESVFGPIKNDLAAELLSITGDQTSKAPTFTESYISKDRFSGKVFSFSTAVPIFMATGLIFVGWMLFLPPHDSTISAVLDGEKNVVLFGFLGAYFFSLQMLFRRFVVNDLRAKAYINVSIRIVLALIAAWVLLSIPWVANQIADVSVSSAETAETTGTQSGVPENVTTSYMFIVAFVIGVFPPVLWRYIRTVFTRIEFTAIPEFENKFPVIELDGLTIWHQARLEEEDIESGFNMANADIIQLMLNTKISTDRIVDWVDQAILLSCISYSSKDDEGNDIEYQQRKNRLQELGFRTASMLDSAKNRKDNTKNWSIEELTDQLQRQGAIDSEIPQLVATSMAIENYTNMELVRSWKNTRNIGADKDLSEAALEIESAD